MDDIGQATLGELILAIYRAAEDPREWALCLERIRQAAGGSGVAIVHHDPMLPGWIADVQAFAGFSPDVIELYTSHYYQLDPWACAVRAQHWAAGQVVEGRTIVPDATFRRSEYYADFGRHCGSAQALFAFLEPTQARLGVLTLNRGDDRPPFDDKAHRLLETLAPHLCQALRVHRRLATADATRHAACDALDLLPMGIVLVNERGAPVFVNAVARNLATRRDGLTIDRHELRGATPAATRTLTSAIRTAILVRQGKTAIAHQSAFLLPRPEDRAPIRVVVVPTGQPGGLGADVGAFAAVFLGDPYAAAIDEGRLGLLFGLTATEARVAARLVNGETIDEMASVMGTSPATVRWHVKHVLHKAQVHTQGQFVSLVLHSPATLRTERR